MGSRYSGNRTPKKKKKRSHKSYVFSFRAYRVDTDGNHGDEAAFWKLVDEKREAGISIRKYTIDLWLRDANIPEQRPLILSEADTIWIKQMLDYIASIAENGSQRNETGHSVIQQAKSKAQERGELSKDLLDLIDAGFAGDDDDD